MSNHRLIEILEHRIAWATKYGQAALDRNDRQVASVFSTIERNARAELEALR